MDNQTYQLELKQIVEFPRCRIYRDFIRSLITNKGKAWRMDLHSGRSAHMVPVPVRFQHQAVSILDNLQKQNYITFALLENKKVAKFKITDWPKDNTVLEYNFPCKKDDGFFFFSIAKVHELISMGKCSEGSSSYY